jgi:hypothetical protein
MSAMSTPGATCTAYINQKSYVWRKLRSMRAQTKAIIVGLY